MHTPTDFNSIVSFVGPCNYKLAKYLCNLLSPHLPEQLCTNDTFTFVEELKQTSLVDKILVFFMWQVYLRIYY